MKRNLFVEQPGHEDNAFLISLNPVVISLQEIINGQLQLQNVLLLSSSVVLSGPVSSGASQPQMGGTQQHLSAGNYSSRRLKFWDGRMI